MKKTLILCVVVAAALISMMFTSCARMADRFTYAATFHVSDTLYDGQSYKFHRFRIYNYAFSCDRPDVMKIYKHSDKSWSCTVDLPGAEPVVVKVSAENADFPDESSNHVVTHATTVYPWKLESSASENGLRVEMVGINEKGETWSVSENRGIWTTWAATGSIVWEYDKSQIELDTKSYKTVGYVTFKGDCTKATVKGILGAVEHSIEITKE